MNFHDFKGLFLVFAFLVWLWNRNKIGDWKLLLGLFLSITLTSELSAWICGMNGIKNYFIYNPFVLVDYVLSNLILYKINSNKKESKRIFICGGIMILISVFWFLKTHSLVKGFNHNSLFISSFFIIIHSIVTLFRKAEESDESLLFSGEVWVSFSMLVYYVCFLPSHGMGMYLVYKENYELARQLMFMNDILFCLKYSLVLIGILLIKKSYENGK